MVSPRIACLALIASACGRDPAGPPPIRFLHTFGPEETELFNAAMAGRGIAVDPSLVPFARGQQVIGEILRAGIDCPDLIRIDATWLRAFVAAELLLPVPEALARLDWTPEAAALGAVNTIVFRDGRRIGHNTDAGGFRKAFERRLPGARTDRVVQLGAGGAGAAVANAILALGARRLTILDRDRDRAGMALVAALPRRSGGPPMTTLTCRTCGDRVSAGARSNIPPDQAECRVCRRKRRPEIPKPALPTLVCAQCGQPFEPKRTNQKYCTVECRARRHRQSAGWQRNAGTTTERGYGAEHQRERKKWRAIVDAGKKLFTADTGAGVDGYGAVLYSPRTMVSNMHARMARLSEEHGTVETPGGLIYDVGDPVFVVPNHACVAVATRRALFAVEGDEVVGEWAVMAR